MSRVYNFSAGPAVLPIPVLEQIKKDIPEHGRSGMTVMEMSHRGKDFKEIIEKAEADLRKLMAIPDNYKVLFLQGGASMQFAMVPLNLMVKSKKADFVNTGSWSKKAIKEAKKVGEVHVVASSEDKNFTYIPELDPATFTADADYFHITTNNTIFGTKFPELPDTGRVPLVADMSSNILSQPFDVGKFGLIYAGAQKNIGPAGVTVVIIRDDLVGLAPEQAFTFLDYKTHAEAASLFNTPSCFAIYAAGLVFQWLIDMGGIAEMEKVNQSKAAMLYDFLDNSSFFDSTVEPRLRSIMNIPFVLPNEALNEQFIAEAEKEGLKTLKGHRSVGGMRASIYNAMPVEGVQKLVDFMKAFEKNNA